MKTCKHCKETKPEELFRKGRPQCKECWKIKARIRDRIRSKKPKRRAWANANQRKRHHTDPQHRIKAKMRKHLWRIMNGSANTPLAEERFGGTADFLRNWIESQFHSGMTWKNRGVTKGKWSIDHKMAWDLFDLEDPEQLRQANHYTNLQPLWHSKNASDSNKVVYNMKWDGTKWN
jgi:hypothetical protein